jgi:hypothetical protein
LRHEANASPRQEITMDTLRRFIPAIGLAIAASALAGCAPVRVNAYLEPGVRIGGYETFGWAQADNLATGDPRLDNNPFFAKRVRSEVERHLSLKGFEKTASGAPDLLIHYYASVTQRIDMKGLDLPYEFCEEEDCGPYVYEEGTLVIDLVDARSNRLVWRGWAENVMDGAIDDQAWMEMKVDDAVRRILARLPSHRETS